MFTDRDCEHFAFVKEPENKEWPFVTNDYLRQQYHRWVEETGEDRSRLMEFRSCENLPMFPNIEPPLIMHSLRHNGMGIVKTFFDTKNVCLIPKKKLRVSFP